MRLTKYLLIAPFVLGSLAVVQKVSADANDGLMVNFMGVKNINWQVNNGLDDSQKQVKEQKNLHVKYYPDAGRNVKHVWISSPDSNYQSTNQNLQFETKTDDQGKQYIEFTVPSLQVWDLIYMN